jgi:hypothetical protein
MNFHSKPDLQMHERIYRAVDLTDLQMCEKHHEQSIGPNPTLINLQNSH